MNSVLLLSWYTTLKGERRGERSERAITNGWSSRKREREGSTKVCGVLFFSYHYLPLCALQGGKGKGKGKGGKGKGKGGHGKVTTPFKRNTLFVLISSDNARVVTSEKAKGARYSPLILSHIGLLC